jgi:hypothetical protein
MPREHLVRQKIVPVDFDVDGVDPGLGKMREPALADEPSPQSVAMTAAAGRS